MKTQEKIVRNLRKRKKKLEKEIDILVEKQDIRGWARKRAEYLEVCYKLQSQKQYLVPQKKVPVVETTIPRVK